MDTKCDPAWENSAYMCTQNLTTFYNLNFNNLSKVGVSINYFVNVTANIWRSDTIYKTCMGYTEDETIEVM